MALVLSTGKGALQFGNPDRAAVKPALSAQSVHRPLTASALYIQYVIPGNPIAKLAERVNAARESLNSRRQIDVIFTLQHQPLD